MIITKFNITTKTYKVFFKNMPINLYIFVMFSVYRFWHSTAAYAIAQAIADYPDSVTLPEQENPIYNWPEDLLQPALIVFLRVNERVRLERLKNRRTLTDQENLLKHQEQFRSK